MKSFTFAITLLLPFLTSCHLIKKNISKKEMKRQIAAVNPNSSKIPISNQPVSAVVFFYNDKPACALSAVEHRRLIPPRFRVAQQNRLSFNLPKCSSKEISLIQDTNRKAVFLDKNAGYQMAGAQLIGAAAICLAGSAVGILLAEETKSETVATAGSYFATATAALFGREILTGGYLSLANSALAIAGACTSIGYTVTYYFITS